MMASWWGFCTQAALASLASVASPASPGVAQRVELHLRHMPSKRPALIVSGTEEANRNQGKIRCFSLGAFCRLSANERKLQITRSCSQTRDTPMALSLNLSSTLPVFLSVELPPQESDGLLCCATSHRKKHVLIRLLLFRQDKQRRRWSPEFCRFLFGGPWVATA